MCLLAEVLCSMDFRSFDQSFPSAALRRSLRTKPFVPSSRRTSYHGGETAVPSSSFTSPTIVTASPERSEPARSYVAAGPDRTFESCSAVPSVSAAYIVTS